MPSTLEIYIYYLVCFKEGSCFLKMKISYFVKIKKTQIYIWVNKIVFFDKNVNVM